MGGIGSGNKNNFWKKGFCPNPAGRPKKEESLTELLRNYGNKKVNEKGGGASYKQELIKSIWKLSLKDATTQKHIFDRIDGPVTNKTEILNKTEEHDNEAMDFIRSDIFLTKQFVHPWYQPAPFHRDIAAYLQNDNIKKLIITLPPQFGKTELLVKTYIPWTLGNNPNKSVILTSYNQEYANKLSVKARDFFNDPKFKYLFGVGLHPDQQTKHEWLIKDYNGGAVFSGVGSSVTGNPADDFIIDDPTKDYIDATSKLKQDDIWNFYNSVASTRLQGDDSRIIIIMTRWNKNDLIGKLLKQEEMENIPQEKRFKVLHFPAILGVENDDFEKGRSLWPEKKSMNFLLDRLRNDRTIFKTMWQGFPKDLENNVIDVNWIKYETDIKALGDRKYSCRGWDFGYSENGDYTVGAKIDVFANGEGKDQRLIPILVDVKRFRENPTITKEKVAEIAIEDGEDVVLGLESGGTQKAMTDNIKNLKSLMNYKTYEDKPEKDKVTRAQPWIIKLSDGIFKFLRGNWDKVVRDEMSEFGLNCDHDDIEDAITIAWRTLFGKDGQV